MLAKHQHAAARAPPGLPTPSVIRVRQDHDLLRHEQMLTALRRLLASLAQIVDEIGRRLDEWMLQNLIDHPKVLSL